MVQALTGVAVDGPRAVGWGRQTAPGLRRRPSRSPTISVTGSMTGVNAGGSGRGVVGTGGGSVVDGAGGGDVVPGGREVDEVDGPDGEWVGEVGEVSCGPPEEPPFDDEDPGGVAPGWAPTSLTKVRGVDAMALSTAPRSGSAETCWSSATSPHSAPASRKSKISPQRSRKLPPRDRSAMAAPMSVSPVGRSGTTRDRKSTRLNSSH